MSVLTKAMAVTFMLIAVFLLSVSLEHSTTQTGSCRPFCLEDVCVSIRQDRVDFHQADKECHDRHGELLTLQSEADCAIFDVLTQELLGNFWMGLHLPATGCSDLAKPLRGYQWTSGEKEQNSTSCLRQWKDSITLCSQHCVSVSSDGTWMERPCVTEADGFLCRTQYKYSCAAEALSEPLVLKSSDGCKSYPCEHNCQVVRGGYICSCLKGYRVDSNDPRRCTVYCAQQKCPAVCGRGADTSCSCPYGFLLSNEEFCEDIDECAMDGCDQECKNTFGSFVCSCTHGYVLKNQVKCMKAEAGNDVVVVPTPHLAKDPGPSFFTNKTLKKTSAGDFLWIWILLTAVVIVLIFVIRLYVVKHLKRREQNSNQQVSGPPPTVMGVNR